MFFLIKNPLIYEHFGQNINIFLYINQLQYFLIKQTKIEVFEKNTYI